MKKINPQLLVYCLLVLIIGYFTYFRNYWFPSALSWDESYHVVSTFKYLNHVMFMTGDPPLGKLIIALGEYLFHPNTSISMQYAIAGPPTVSHVPHGFSFVGIRFFPSLLGMLSSVLFFLTLYKISRRMFLSFLFSAFYLFDNALILQSRGALLDSIQIFFFLSSILYFLVLLEKQKIKIRNYLFLGIIVGSILSVRLNGLVFLLMLPLLLLFEKKLMAQKLHINTILTKSAGFIFGSLLIFIGSYYVQASIGTHVVNNRYYGATAQYKKILMSGHSFSPLQFPLVLSDYLWFIPHYEKRVVHTDSNGSRPYTWPFGNKTINYHWSASQGIARYLYLVGNPLIWFVGGLGLVFGFALLIAVRFFKLPVEKKQQRLFYLTVFFLTLYTGYIAAFMTVTRVVYLYHYLIPMLISVLVGFCLFLYIYQDMIASGNKKLYASVIVVVVCVIGVYAFFSPFTYFLPLTHNEFLMRNWFSFWHLKPVVTR